MRLQKLLALALVVVAPLAVRAQNISTVVGGGPANNVGPTTVSIGAPAAVRQDSLGNTYILDNFGGRVYKVDHTTGNMSVFAGNGTNGFGGEGGLATAAAMSGPSGMCIDANNNVYVADSDNAIIRVIPVVTMNLTNPTRTLSPGNIYTFAGVQTSTDFVYGGDGGPAIATNTSPGANLHFPDGCSFDSHGNLYIADRGNNSIRVVIGAAGVAPVGLPAADNVPGNIYEFAGATPATSTTPPAAGVAVDGTAAAGAALNGPFDVFVDSHDNLWIGLVGNPPPASNPPQTAALIRVVLSTGLTAGQIHTVAGTTTGSGYNGQNIVATTAQITAGQGIFVDASGNLFFADSANQVIREVPAATANGMTAGFIYDVAGTHGSHGETGDNGPATSATLSFPVGTFVDAHGNILIADSNDNAIRVVIGSAGIPPAGLPASDNTAADIYLMAGNLHETYGGDGGPALSAELNNPAGIATDGSGDLAIADFLNSMIRGVGAPIAGGTINVVIGRPENNGFTSDGALSPSSLVNNAKGVAFDASGNIFIADTDNCLVREINITAPASVVTLAGTVPTTSTPNCGFSGQGGLATSAVFGHVNSVAVDSNGNVFFSDPTNHVIWEVAKNTTATMNAGNIYVVAGTPQSAGFNGDTNPATSAHLNGPTGIYIDIFNNLYIADTGNNEVREVPATDITLHGNAVAAGSIYTVAGDHTQAAGFSGDGASATSAQLNGPLAVAVDHSGNLFIADTNNHIIREVTAANGNINTVAGTPKNPGFSGDGHAATGGNLNTPDGLAIDPTTGNLLISDSLNLRIRSVTGLTSEGSVPVVSFSPNTVTFAAQLPNTTSTGQVITLTNIGGASLTGISASIVGSHFAISGNTCGSTLTAGSNCQITVTFTPNAVGSFNASLSVADNAFGSPQSVALSGAGGTATATITPSNAVSFTTPEPVGTAAPTQQITLTNNGNVTLSITSVSAIQGTNPGDFSITANTCGASVAAGSHCNITFKFLPTGIGSRSASVKITDTAADSPQTITLSGTGQGATATLNPSPATLSFGNQPVSVPSTTQSVTLTNNGNIALNISSLSASGDFALQAGGGACSTATPLAAASSCTITVVFTPTASGTRTGTVSIADNATGSPQTVQLSGTGTVAVASINPATAQPFSNQIVNTKSPAQTFTLTNTGLAPLKVASINVTGAGFAETDTCASASINQGAPGCTISVTFAPTATGPVSGSLVITDNASSTGTSTTQTITLTGTGVPVPPGASLSATNVAFPDQFVGTTSATAQTVTLTNNSTSVLNISNIAMTGNTGDFNQTNTCGTSVAANGKCTFTVNFTPTAAGPRAATITVTDNATSGTQTVSLGGNGFTVSLAAASNGSMTQTVKAGQTATYNLQFTAAGGTPSDQISVTVACSGVPALATCNGPNGPVVVTPAAPGTFAITVSTTGSGASLPMVSPQSEPNMQPPAALRVLPLSVLALLFCIAAMLAWMQSPAGRMRTVSVAMTACLVLMPIAATSFLAGCGGGSSGGTTTPPAPTAPSIATQPANQSAPVGQTATFAVTASGTAPLTYQWQKNGTAISGATSASYTTPATTVADNGSTYAVVVSNSAGNATSSNATLSLTTPPASYNITVTSTVSGKQQTSQLTLVVQ